MKKYNIGIVGLGYVGKAVEAYFKRFFNLNTFDTNVESSCSSLEQLVNLSEIIFICLPTPMRKNGSTDLRIIDSVIKDINSIANRDSNKLVAIKSTIPVGTTNKFINKYDKIRICFNPEFLTEANYLDDFKNQNRIILGGDKIDDLFKLYSETFTSAEIVKTDCQTAEMVKYVTNSFLATKVSYANEIESFCKHLNIDYNNMIKIASLDQRLGNSHWSVPGPDGKRGYGGTCFPKDISSLINQFEQNEIQSIILKASFTRNNNIDRKEKDWQKLKGRAVSDN